jgi:flagellar M-ring protein FliF
MNFLNRTFEQIKDLFASMTPGARITAGLLLVVIVVSLVFLFQGGIGGPDDFLLGGRAFSTAELEAIEGAFAKAGLSHYELEGSRVRIPNANKAEYVAALAENQALPANFSDYFTQQASGVSVFESKDQSALRWRVARQQELALIISSMRGIAKAQVIYDETQKTGFPRRTEKTATVAVQATGSAELEPHQVKAIRQLVSGAVAGLSFQNVTVTDLNTNKNYGGGGDGQLASADENAYLDYKSSYERQWVDKIQKALAFVPGAVVTVDVELSKETVLQEDTVTIDPKPVTISSNTTEKSSTNRRPGPGGRPGVGGQNGVANQQASIGGAGGGDSTTEETSESIERLGGHGRLVKSTAPLVPKKVTAAIGVPSSYYAQIWKERNPTPAGQEAKPPDVQQFTAIEQEVIKKVEDMVVNLIPKLQPGEDKYPLVTVKTFQHLAAPPATEPGIAQTAAAWASDNWSTLGVLLLGAMGLVMLRGMLKAKPSTAGPSGSPATAGVAEMPRLAVVSEDTDEKANTTAAGEASAAPRRRFANAGANIKDELASMVRENPDAAASILRSWIGEAS